MMSVSGISRQHSNGTLERWQHRWRAIRARLAGSDPISRRYRKDNDEVLHVLRSPTLPALHTYKLRHGDTHSNFF